jgi:HPt (histidine-containing phosphotransfer) domain-containing protein
VDVKEREPFSGSVRLLCCLVATRAKSNSTGECRFGGENVMTAQRLMSAPASDCKVTAIDENHLGRMTLGDRRLEREVLELFLRQTTLMLNRIVGAQPPLAAAAAHTLKGSARGIGAWRVARAAELLEDAVGDAGGHDAGCDLDDAITELKAASLEVSAAIGARLTELLSELGRER